MTPFQPFINGFFWTWNLSGWIVGFLFCAAFSLFLVHVILTGFFVGVSLFEPRPVTNKNGQNSREGD